MPSQDKDIQSVPFWMQDGCLRMVNDEINSDFLQESPNRSIHARSDKSTESSPGGMFQNTELGASNSPSKKRRKTSEQNPNNRRGHWELEESKKYLLFLELHSSHFICSERRRADKIFKAMSTFIGTREAEQCRSHHQKMQKKCITYQHLIRHLRLIHFESCSDRFVLDQLIRRELLPCEHGFNLLSEHQLTIKGEFPLKKSIKSQQSCDSPKRAIKAIKEFPTSAVPSKNHYNSQESGSEFHRNFVSIHRNDLSITPHFFLPERDEERLFTGFKEHCLDKNFDESQLSNQ